MRLSIKRATWPPKCVFFYFFVFSRCRYHGLHSDLQRVPIETFRLFRRGGSAKGFFFGPPPPLLTVLSLLARPSSRNRLLGVKLSSRTKPENNSTRGGADEMPCDHGSVQTNVVTIGYNRVHVPTTNGNKSHNKEEKVKSAHACMHV